MSNHKLDNISREEIRRAVEGLSQPMLKATVKELAERYEVSEKSIYAMTKDLRPQRKKRTDAGKRKADLLEDDGLKFAAMLVTNTHCRPEDALETARINGHEIKVSLATFQKYLREIGVSRKQNRTKTRPHRRFEASAPGEIGQYDDSAIKTRWLDVETRKIYKTTELEVSKNHPNKNSKRVNLWRQVYVDDFSRRRFVKYVATHRLNSNHVIDFLLEAYRRFGVPLKLYTDNAGTIIGRRGQYAEKLLNMALADSGGFKMEQHLPGNSQATGKVERSHQAVEETEKLIGVFELVKGYSPTLEQLNEFALNACDKYDWIKHSTTGVEPMIRWQSSTKALRIPPDATLNAAFKVAEYNVPLYNDVTIKVEGEIIQLSRQKTDGLSLVDYVGQKVTVLLPAGESWLVVITADGNEFTMDRLQATPDKAGEFKTLPETKGQRARKLLKEEAKAFKQQVKERREEDDEILVPHFDTKVDEQAKPLVFPRKQEAMPIAHIPGAAAFNQDRLLDRYQAYDWLIEQGYWSEPSDSETEWWKSLFTDREEITEAELRHAIEAQQAPGEVTYLRRA